MNRFNGKIWLAIAGAAFFSCLTASSAQAFSPGETKIFNVDSTYDLASRSQLSATLRYVGDQAIFYLDDAWWKVLSPVDLANNKEAISSLLLEFDRTIYPRLTQVYGSEWKPGIDNEPRLKILISPMKKITGGYFNSADEYLRTQLPQSNESEIIYLNSTYLTTSSMKVFLAHEFAHMINFYQKDKLRNVSEDIWLNEARAEYAATLCGYDRIYSGSNLERRVADFLRAPTDSLTEWINQPADYGAANLFMQYFVARYGEAVLTRSIQSDGVGIVSLDAALTALGFVDHFEDIFVNWVVANYINDCQFGAGQKFCYLNPWLDANRLHVNPLAKNFLTVKEGTEFSFADAIKDWSGHWYEILPLGEGWNLKLNFQGLTAGNFQVPMIIFYKNSNKEFRFLKLNGGQTGQDLILNFGNGVAKVALMVVSRMKQSGFSANDASQTFSYTASITASSSLPALPEITPSPTATPSAEPGKNLPAARNVYPDGSLLRASGQSKVYIISGDYKRWIQSPQIFNAYSHFSWQNIIEVSQAELNSYQEAWLVRAAGDSRVYEINGDGTKHWLNMSAEQFLQSGRKWEMVYIVNKTERDWYRTGADVLK